MTRILTKRTIGSPNSVWTAAIAAIVALSVGGAALSAHAEERRDDRRGGDHRDDRDHRGYRGYGGGYYNPPPVVYGSPCGWGGCPPPLVYGPGVGIVLPNIMLNIR